MTGGFDVHDVEVVEGTKDYVVSLEQPSAVKI